MATLPGLVKDASSPVNDTQISPISVPDGTILLTTKQHNQIVDYLSGDAGPNFIPQAAIDSLVVDLAARELLVNKGAINGYAPLGSTSLVPTENLGTGVADATTFLRGDGTWAVPPGAGGGEVNTSSNAIIDSSTEKGLALAKDGLDLPFRVMAIGSTNMSIASDAGKVTIDVLPANLTGIPQSGITNLVTDLSNKQPINSKLTEISGLTFVDDDIIQQKVGVLVNRTPIQLKTDLALVKSDVGLGNVDNTSDANKPVSTATQTALDLKEDSLGFTPEDIANKGAVSGYAGLDASQELLLANFPSGAALQVLRRNAANTALEFATISAGGGQVDSVVGTTNRISINSADPVNPIVDIDAAYVGQTTITTLGTITTGVWNGDAITGANINAALADLSDVTAKTGSGTIVVMDTSPTIVTPTIASFVNAAHDHLNAIGGGTLTATAISDFDTAVSANSDVTANTTKISYTDAAAVALNTAKVTNATHTGEVTGDTILTIANDAVTYAKMQNVVADDVILGNITGPGGIVTELTGAQVNTILPTFTDVLDGLAPLSGGGTTNFLRADGTWAVPAGGGDMVLATVQTVTGAKTFEDTTFFLRNVADTFSASFVNTITADTIYTLPDAAGTIVITGLASQITLGNEVTGASTDLTDSANLVRNNQANTYTGGGIQDFGTANLINITNLEMTGFLEIDNSTLPADPTSGSRIFAVNQNGFSHLKQVDSNSVLLDLLEDQTLTVRNTSGATMLKGQVVYITGASGNIVTVDLAQADVSTTVPAVGIVHDDISNNAFGRVLLVGNLSGVDTSAFNEGDSLFVSELTAGAFTNIQPPHPFQQQSVGHVTTSGSNGNIHVFVTNLNGKEVGTNQNTYKIGDGLAGTKTLDFVNLFTGSLSANPTATRTWNLPDVSGTISLIGATETLTNKTLTTPTIASFTNATHDHSPGAGGGNLTNTALTSGVFPAITGVGIQTQALDLGGFDLDNIQNLIHNISTSGIDIDFLEDTLQTISIITDTTFTTVNIVAGKSKTLKITTDGTLRTLDFPAWDWVSDIPTDQAANKNGYLTLTAYGTTDASIVAAYQVGFL